MTPEQRKTVGEWLHARLAEEEQEIREYGSSKVGRGIVEWLQTALTDIETEPAVTLRPAQMDAPGGPVCGCGAPSRHESGWCGGACSQALGFRAEMQTFDEGSR